jgi:hypothetical protein
MESAMRGWLAASALSVVLLALPAGASGATIGLLPQKSCYRTGQRGDPNADKPAFLGGTGFTPNAPVAVTLDHRPAGQTTADAGGLIRGTFVFGGLRSAEHNWLLAATDQANPANVATLALRTTGVAVNVTPRRAGPGRRVRIRGRGFTGSKRLYAHVRGARRYRRNVRVGRLKRSCHKLDRRVRIIPLGTRAGVYTVQFDGKRRYSKRTAPRILYRVTIFRRLVRRSSTSAAAESWIRLP